jgi:hypothetical protein
MMYSTNIRNLNLKYLILWVLKNDKIWQNFKGWSFALSTTLDVRFCYLCAAQNTGYFELRTFRVGRVYYFHIWNFFSDFFGTSKCHFWIIQKTSPCSSWPKTLHSFQAWGNSLSLDRVNFMCQHSGQYIFVIQYIRCQNYISIIELLSMLRLIKNYCNKYIVLLKV